MFKDNTKQVNKIIATTLLWSTFIIIALFLTNVVGIFDFGDTIRGVILIVGLMATIVPYILMELKVSDVFLKYYMLIAISILIGTLGSSDSLGIYITYVLVPIISCLYFDKKFTIVIGIISYFVMGIGVFFNSAGKLEVTYYNWSHYATFRNYMIGFSFEYFAVLIFIYQFVKRAQTFMELQYKSLAALKEENDRQRKMASIVSEAFSDENKIAFNLLSDDSDNFTPENQARLSAGHQFIANLQNLLVHGDDADKAITQVFALIGEYFGIERILFLEKGLESDKSKLSYQWSRRPQNKLNDFCTDLPQEAQEQFTQLYKENGYIEVNEHNPYAVPSGLSRYMTENMIGDQLWIPVIEDGIYVGGMCFERGSMENFSSIDMFLLTEAAGIIASHIMRLNSDYANNAKSSFLSSMSHEIRTPMNAIMGMTTVALREDVNDNVRKCLNVIRSSSEGLLTIINDILDFSKIESGRIEIIPEDYQVMSLLNDVNIMANARNTEKGLEIKYEYKSDLPSVLYGDYVRIKQVMINLVTNSIKYTDEGSVTVRLSCQNQDDNTALMRFEVADTGQGIKEEDLGKLFTSYSQVNQEQNHHKEGTGLGLNISKQLIELMGGKIGVSSTYGVGSTFFFEIPQEIKDSTPAGTLEQFEYNFNESMDDEQFKAPDARVLIVDDNELNLMIEETLFSTFMMNITTAQSGMEALRLIKANTYDLIFMDHFMPEMDGVETTQAIRKLEGNPNQNVPIIALTADAISGVREEMLSAGMNDFLSKPIDMPAATRILQEYLK